MWLKYIQQSLELKVCARHSCFDGSSSLGLIFSLTRAAGKHRLQSADVSVQLWIGELYQICSLGKGCAEPRTVQPVCLSLLAKQWSHPCCLQMFYLQCSRGRKQGTRGEGSYEKKDPIVRVLLFVWALAKTTRLGLMTWTQGSVGSCAKMPELLVLMILRKGKATSRCEQAFFQPSSPLNLPDYIAWRCLHPFAWLSNCNICLGGRNASKS